MPETNDNIYVGSGKVVGNYGTVAVSICLTDLPKEHMKKSTKNQKVYINLDIDVKKEPDNYGNTHSVKVDTYKPPNQG